VKKIEMNLTRLQEILLILAAISSQPRSALRTLLPVDVEENDDLYFTVCNYLQILICNFLDEWKRLAPYASDSEIQKALRIASPAVERTRRWKGLRRIRSRLLAHGLRDKDGHPAWHWDVFEEYEAPTAYAGTILLGECAVRAIHIALERHEREHAEGLKELVQRGREIDDRGIRTRGDIQAELERIYNEIRKVAQEVTQQPVCGSLDFPLSLWYPRSNSRPERSSTFVCCAMLVGGRLVKCPIKKT
jgi:hypothetical protein